MSESPDWASVLFGDMAAVEVFLWIVAVGGLIALAIKLWPVLSRFVRTVNSITQLPEFMDRTDATLKAQDALIKEIHHESMYNDETSMKDAVRRTELGVKAAVKVAVAHTESLDAIRAEIAELKPKD